MVWPVPHTEINASTAVMLEQEHGFLSLDARALTGDDGEAGVIEVSTFDHSELYLRATPSSGTWIVPWDTDFRPFEDAGVSFLRSTSPLYDATV